MATDRYQRGLDRMMELVSTEHSNTYDHAKLVESYKSLDPELSDYIVSFAFGDIYSRKNLTQQEQTLVTISARGNVQASTQLLSGVGGSFEASFVSLKSGLSTRHSAGSVSSPASCFNAP